MIHRVNALTNRSIIMELIDILFRIDKHIDNWIRIVTVRNSKNMLNVM